MLATTKKTSALLAAAFLLLSLSQFALAAEWMAVRSGNLLITGQTTEAELRTIAQRLERFRSALGNLSPRLRGDSAHPVNVVILPDDPAYSNFGLRRQNGTFDETVAGYFVRGEDANFITLSGAGRSSDPYHTIFHEYVHNLLRSRGSGDVPAWLNEGLAQYLETAEFTADGKFVLGKAPKGRLELLERSELLPLKKLLSATNEEVHSGGTPKTVFYCQSWLLVHRLMTNASGSSFKDRLEQIFEISGDHQALEKLVGSAAESSLRAYAISRPGTHSVELKSEGPVEAAAEEMTPGAANALLGNLLLRLGRAAEAEVFVRRSLEIDKTSPQANSSMGEILISKGKHSEARSHLEAAERSGDLSPVALFNLAYSLVKEAGDKNQLIGKLPADITDRVRGYLKRSIQRRASFVEAYKLLGHVALINNDQLREGASLLMTAIALKPDDAELQLMLAKIYLRLDQHRDASAIAEKITAGSAAPSIKKEAQEVQSAASEYLRTNLELGTIDARAPTRNLMFLKRSWLTNDDLKRIELNRELANLNSVLDRPRPGEVQIMGSIDRITCSDGAIAYTIISNGVTSKLWGSGFEGLRLAVLVQGMHSFKMDCGARFRGQPAVLLYKPADTTKDGSKPQLTSVTFVPENFQLMNLNDLMGARTIVVEDDMLRRNRERDSIERYSRVSDSERFESIRGSLRRPAAGEKQIVGKLDRVDCSSGTTQISATVGGTEWRFNASVPNNVAVNWFTSTGLHFRLACGTEPVAANVVLTYKASNAGTPELTAIEFIPADLPLPIS